MESGSITQKDKGFDLDNLMDMQVYIDWNDATEINGVSINGTSLSSTDYDVSGTDLTVYKEAIQDVNPTSGDTLDVEVTFDVGNDSFEINVVKTSELTNIDLSSASASASSTETTSDTADKAIDSDSNTRWASSDEFSPTEWIYVNLGSKKDITTLEIEWEAAAMNYSILVSDDGSSWTEVKNETSHSQYNYSSGGSEIVTLPTTVNSQYIKIEASGSTGTAGVSIFELDLYQ